jgi:outer membrane protein assembly factor BamD (BamD/ComL family)
VAEQHGGTLAGEAALFAQARAEIASGQRDAARATLQRYLARHPSGRFVSEARSHLQRLGAK